MIRDEFNYSTPKRTNVDRMMRCYSGGVSGSHSSSDSRSRPQLMPQEFIDMFVGNLPSVLGTMAGQANPVSNLMSQAGLGQLNQFGAGYQQAGANLGAAQAGSTNQLLQGAGGDAARTAVNLNNQLNPAQAAANQRAVELINKPDLSGNLTPGEQNAIERGLGQQNALTGNLGLLNPMNVVNNAMQFGNAATQRQQQQFSNLSNALGVGAGVASSQNQQVNPFGVAMGSADLSNNFGMNQFNPFATNLLPFQFGSQFGSQLANIGSAQVSKGRSRSTSGGIGAGV